MGTKSWLILIGIYILYSVNETFESFGSKKCTYKVRRKLKNLKKRYKEDRLIFNNYRKSRKYKKLRKKYRNLKKEYRNS